jgi:hypothetical protein
MAAPLDGAAVFSGRPASGRVYRPTARLPLLVGWIGARLFREGRVIEVMNELSQATGETIILGAEN